MLNRSVTPKMLNLYKQTDGLSKRSSGYTDMQMRRHADACVHEPSTLNVAPAYDGCTATSSSSFQQHYEMTDLVAAAVAKRAQQSHSRLSPCQLENVQQTATFSHDRRNRQQKTSRCYPAFQAEGSRGEHIKVRLNVFGIAKRRLFTKPTTKPTNRNIENERMICVGCVLRRCERSLASAAFP